MFMFKDLQFILYIVSYVKSYVNMYTAVMSVLMENEICWTINTFFIFFIKNYDIILHNSMLHIHLNTLKKKSLLR